MAVLVNINGTLRGEADATVSVFDRGFLYGDSVYEVTRTAGGKPVELEAHLDRLKRSAASLALPLPTAASLTGMIRDTLAAAGNPESYLRVVVTRGEGEVGLDVSLADQPNVIVIVKPLALPPEEAYQRGVSLQIVDVQRNPRRSIDPSVKSGNYLNNILALMEARQKGAYESLMCDADGRVAEGSTSNVFCARGGTLITPSVEIGLLEGITRARVMRLAKECGIPVEEGTLWPDSVRSADEVFITSSIRGVLPVAAVDGAEVGRATPGPLTAKLMASYRQFLEQVASAV